MSSKEHAPSDDELRKHFAEIVARFTTAMLVTRTPEGALRARPLTVAGAEPSGALYFSTSLEAPKVHEIEADAHVVVTFQSDKAYGSVSGTARLSRDRALIDRLWKETWRVWFPKGKDDPSLAILIVTPTAAEYWDQSGLGGVKYVLRSLKAYVTRTRAPDAVDPGQNAKVPLR
jgi:general stress protein 26